MPQQYSATIAGSIHIAVIDAAVSEPVVDALSNQLRALAKSATSVGDEVDRTIPADYFLRRRWVDTPNLVWLRFWLKTGLLMGSWLLVINQLILRRGGRWFWAILEYLHFTPKCVDLCSQLTVILPSAAVNLENKLQQKLSLVINVGNSTTYGLKKLLNFFFTDARGGKHLDRLILAYDVPAQFLERGGQTFHVLDKIFLCLTLLGQPPFKGEDEQRKHDD